MRREYGRLDVDAFLERLGVAGHAVEDLAGAWGERRPTPFRLVLAFAAAGAELDDYQGIRAWVSIDMAVADHQRSQVVGDAIVDAAFVSHLEHGDLGPGLHIPDEDLARRLPLLDLAEDLARHRGDRLVVENRAPDGMWGCITVTPTAGAIVCLDGTLDDDELARTFAHELAHGLDPDDVADVDWRGLEAFADALGAMLLEAEPATVRATVFLVMRALDATAGLRTLKPDGSLASLLEHVLVEVGARLQTGPELLAARHGGPGVNRRAPMGLGHPRRSPQGHTSPSSARWHFLRRDGALRPGRLAVRFNSNRPM